MKAACSAFPLKGRLLELLMLLEEHEELCRPEIMPLMQGTPSEAGVGVTLHRMEKDGWLTSRLEGKPSGRHRRRRFYRLSKVGKCALETHHVFEKAATTFDRTVEDAVETFQQRIMESTSNNE